MDITPQDNTQPISDDQELAKALAGVLPEDDSTTNSSSPNGMQFEEPIVTTIAAPAPAGDPAAAPEPTIASTIPQFPAPEAVEPISLPTPPVAPLSTPETPSFGMPAPSFGGDESLDAIKLDAMKELRPLMDKVELPAEEKFDTYLMLIRSTDDSTLIGPAHTAAQNISDEKRKAEALLEIIKEIDYLSRKDQPTA
jgi:hypothetical protein